MVRTWTHQFDGNVENIFDLQDQMTAGVAGAKPTQLEQAQIERGAPRHLRKHR